jgi:hypothetical protein
VSGLDMKERKQQASHLLPQELPAEGLLPTPTHAALSAAVVGSQMPNNIGKLILSLASLL